MAGRGRGRGRGDFLPAGLDERRPLRRPGDVRGDSSDRISPRKHGDDTSTSNLEADIQKLSVSGVSTEEEIAILLQRTTSETQLLQVLGELHDRALTCSPVGARLAAAAGRLQAEASEGSHLRNLRTHMLNFVQADYKRRHDDRIGDPARFACAGSLLCDVFRCVRLADGSAVQVLATPILEYLMALLHCRQEDQVLAAAQLCRIGEELTRCSPEGVEELVNSVRERLISPECSPALRADLLLCVELAAGRWAGLSPHARHFYAHHGVSVPDFSAAPRRPAAPGPTSPPSAGRGEERSVGREPPRGADGRPPQQNTEWNSVPLPEEENWD